MKSISQEQAEFIYKIDVLSEKISTIYDQLFITAITAILVIAALVFFLYHF